MRATEFIIEGVDPFRNLLIALRQDAGRYLDTKGQAGGRNFILDINQRLVQLERTKNPRAKIISSTVRDLMDVAQRSSVNTKGVSFGTLAHTLMQLTQQELQKVATQQGVAEGKITLSTDPNWYGATVNNYQASGPVVNIPANQLVGFEPDDKMNQPKSKVNVEKIVAGLKQGAKLPPLLVRKYKNGYQVLDGHHRFWAYKLLGVKSIPAQIVPDSDIEEISKQGVGEGKVINTYLWHGSRQKIPMLEPRQSVDTGGAAGSNQNAIYATSDPKVAIAMGLTTAGSDTGMFPNDPQMVLFSGKIRKGEYVYLHKLPFNGPDGKPQFVQGGNSREFHSIPGVEGIKPIEIKEIPVNKYLNLIRKATPADLKLRKKYMKKQGVGGR